MVFNNKKNSNGSTDPPKLYNSATMRSFFLVFTCAYFPLLILSVLATNGTGDFKTITEAGASASMDENMRFVCISIINEFYKEDSTIHANKI